VCLFNSAKINDVKSKLKEILFMVNSYTKYKNCFKENCLFGYCLKIKINIINILFKVKQNKKFLKFR